MKTKLIVGLGLFFFAAQTYAVDPRPMSYSKPKKKVSAPKEEIQTVPSLPIRETKTAPVKEKPKIIKETVLDGFEANDWLPSNADGTTIKTNLDVGLGKIGRALQIDYDLAQTKQWVAIIKDISISEIDGKAIQFYLKSRGAVNNAEVKLIDDDGTNYGYKFPLKPKDTWELVTIDLDDFSYWWGGNSKLDLVTQFGLAISAGEGGTGTIYLDDLKLVDSWKKQQEKVQSGVLDGCDSLEGWKIEGDQGTTSKMILMPGKEREAIGSEYKFGSGKWIQFTKSYPVEITAKSVFSFSLKWTGEQNNFEFKLVDKENTTFGKKFPLARKDEWQEIRIPFSELSYWWGGDDKELNMKNIKLIGFAVSFPKGGEGLILIDNIKVDVMP